MATGTDSPGKGKRGTQAQQALKEALNTEAPVFPYPDDLDPRFKDIWRRTVNVRTGDYWNKGDIPLLMLYCRCAHDIQRLDLEIHEEGEVILNARENQVVNPKVVIRGFAENRFMVLCTKLHMQPAARGDTNTEANQLTKKAKATRAASTIGGDEDGLLAGVMQ